MLVEVLVLLSMLLYCGSAQVVIPGECKEAPLESKRCSCERRQNLICMFTLWSRPPVVRARENYSEQAGPELPEQDRDRQAGEHPQHSAHSHRDDHVATEPIIPNPCGERSNTLFKCSLDMPFGCL